MADSQTTQVGYAAEPPQEYGHKIRCLLAQSNISEHPITLGTKTGDKFECIIDYHDKEDGIVHLRINLPDAVDFNRFKILSIPECQVSWILT